MNAEKNAVSAFSNVYDERVVNEISIDRQRKLVTGFRPLRRPKN